MFILLYSLDSLKINMIQIDEYEFYLVSSNYIVCKMCFVVF